MLVAELNVRVRDFCKKLRLFPPIWNCYGVQLGQRGLLPIHVEPTIAEYHRRRAEMALSVLDSELPDRNYLCGAEPTIADLFCYGDVAFAELCAFDLHRWTNVVGWSERVKALTGFRRRSRCWPWRARNSDLMSDLLAAVGPPFPEKATGKVAF